MSVIKSQAGITNEPTYFKSEFFSETILIDSIISVGVAISFDWIHLQYVLSQFLSVFLWNLFENRRMEIKKNIYTNRKQIE